MADSYWFKINPEKYLSIAGRIPDGTQRAEFLLVCIHCLSQGALPNDDAEISFITAIQIERISALRPYLNRLCDLQGGTLIPFLAQETIFERQEYSAKKAEAGQKGGKQSQAVLKQSQAVLKQTEALIEQTEALIEPNKQTNKQTDKQASHAISDEPSPIFAALERIYPGHSTNFRTMSELFSLTEKLSATLAQVENFPRWLEEKHPKKANSPFAFKDLFPDSIKNGNASPQPQPTHCKNCGGAGRKPIVVDNKLTGFKICEVCNGAI